MTSRGHAKGVAASVVVLALVCAAGSRPCAVGGRPGRHPGRAAGKARDVRPQLLVARRPGRARPHRRPPRQREVGAVRGRHQGGPGAHRAHRRRPAPGERRSLHRRAGARGPLPHRAGRGRLHHARVRRRPRRASRRALVAQHPLGGQHRRLRAAWDRPRLRARIGQAEDRHQSPAGQAAGRELPGRPAASHEGDPMKLGRWAILAGAGVLADGPHGASGRQERDRVAPERARGLHGVYDGAARFGRPRALHDHHRRGHTRPRHPYARRSDQLPEPRRRHGRHAPDARHRRAGRAPRERRRQALSFAPQRPRHQRSAVRRGALRRGRRRPDRPHRSHRGRRRSRLGALRVQRDDGGHQRHHQDHQRLRRRARLGRLRGGPHLPRLGRSRGFLLAVRRAERDHRGRRVLRALRAGHVLPDRRSSTSERAPPALSR